MPDKLQCEKKNRFFDGKKLQYPYGTFKTGVQDLILFNVKN